MLTTSTEMLDFEAFLRTEGYHLNMPPEEARERMRTDFSKASLQRFEQLMEIKKQRPYRPDEFYSVPETLAEAALFFSPQAHVNSACGQHLYRTIKPYLRPGIKIADMGCGLGSWTRWVAEHHTETEVTGFDRHDVMLTIAKSVAKPSNCHFVESDFVELSAAYGSFDLIVSLLGIDFNAPAIIPHLDTLFPEDSTKNSLTEHFARTFASVASGWKRILAPKGSINAVLALPSFELWYGCVAGAASLDLKLNLEASSCIAVGKQRYPLLVFEVVSEPVVMDLDILLDWWVDRTCTSADAPLLLDAPALLRYRRLQNRKVLDITETKYDDGHYMRKETGLADGVGYVYEYATTLYRRLECIAESKLQGDGDKPVFMYESDHV